MKRVPLPSKPSATKQPDEWVTGKHSSTTPMKRLTIDLPADLHRRAKLGSVRDGVTLADLVRTYLEGRFPAEGD